MRCTSSVAALASLAFGWLGLLLPAAAETRISGPFVHENLAVYTVHGPSAPGRVPLTLQEALTAGSVQVHETGNVNELKVENTGSEEVFVQAGDIVKGGKQDRVLTVSLILPPASGKLAIGSFCVEQGRWAARGKEDVSRFSSASAALPSREAKMAMLAPLKPRPETEPAARPSPSGGIGGRIEQRRVDDPRSGAASETGYRQKEMWDNVKRMQDKLSGKVGAPVAAVQSASSLQLSLENERLAAARKAYVEALRSVGEKEADVVGYVLAINGRLSSGDVYPSNGLFRKMWAKQLEAGVTEAISDKDANSASPPAVDAVKAFLDAGASAPSTTRSVAAKIKLETRDGEKSLYTEATRTDGGFIHRNYLAKH